jgi:hypothetical protein
MNKQIIIAKYKEDISWVNELKYDYIVYDKSGKRTSDNYIYLPNEFKAGLEGRDAHTWLHHIINNYHNLADQNLFVQGHPFDHCNNALELMNDNWVGHFRPLGEIWHTYVFDKDVTNKVFKDLWGITKTPEMLSWIQGIQFDVSKQVLQSHPIEYYQKCWDVISGFKNNHIPVYFEQFWIYILVGNDKNLIKLFSKFLSNYEPTIHGVAFNYHQL